MDKVRLDKWLWAARFFKTRSLAVQAIEKGRVHVNDAQPKPGKDVAINDLISVRRDDQVLIVRVAGVSNIRGPATVARELYQETQASIEAREQAAERRRLSPEPALNIEAGRPTKRDRRRLTRLHEG